MTAHQHLTAIQVKKELLSLDKQSANFAYYESLWQHICATETLDSQILQATSVAELDQILRAANNVEWKSNETTALLRESLPYGKDEMGRKKEISSVPKESAGTLNTGFSQNVVCCTIL